MSLVSNLSGFKNGKKQFDVVIYGATGFTGHYVVERLVASKYYHEVNFAIAGRNEGKLRQVLEKVSGKTGIDIYGTPMIIADSSDPDSLARMAQQAKVIINTVGPFTLYGEAVLRAAIENRAHHVDITGEYPWVEKMKLKYEHQAKENGVYIVSCCAFDSIPADLGVNFLKKNFGGDLNHVEAFMQIIPGPDGYALNDGTYQTIVGSMGEYATKMLSSGSKLMPRRIVKGSVKPPFRMPISKIDEAELDGYALPFPTTDQTIVDWSQYNDATVKDRRPIHIKTYIRVPSVSLAVGLGLWSSAISVLAVIPCTKRLLQKYPDEVSFNLFKRDGPTEAQINGSGFTYTFFGYGYQEQKPNGEVHLGRPDRKVVARCTGPDPGYMATSGCIISSALTILKDVQNMPEEGGFYTPTAAFGDSKIYEFLESFGVKYEVLSERNL
ncbi:unnamed protein product [Caenorhabditis auriculariae]|uniref:Saccharopine dehydrogenase NADP binding domain-containing protein n=1 Tax=Caenorhabditis auriculariae TaxID=2777116 RepID=A0A8S1HAI3_9PELO|nr:unnamed protein product [Caenorhabditis auriculariae]